MRSKVRPADLWGTRLAVAGQEVVDVRGSLTVAVVWFDRRNAAVARQLSSPTAPRHLWERRTSCCRVGAVIGFGVGWRFSLRLYRCGDGLGEASIRHWSFGSRDLRPELWASMRGVRCRCRRRHSLGLDESRSGRRAPGAPTQPACAHDAPCKPGLRQVSCAGIVVRFWGPGSMAMLSRLVRRSRAARCGWRRRGRGWPCPA